MTDTNTGQYFVELLESVSGLGISNPRAVRLANAAWDSWEKQGVSRGKDTDDVIHQPHLIFKKYYLDIVKANNLKNKNVHFCLARTKELNAYANTTKNGDYVVVFDSELYTFINDVIITCIVCVYSHPSDDEVDFYFSHVYDLFLQFKGFTIKKSSEEQGDDFVKIITKDYDLTMLGSYCGAAIYAFIICHELGHHILGHTKKGKVKKAIFSENTEVSIGFNKTSIEEEFEADEIGFHLYTNISKEYENLKDLKLNNQFISVPLIFFKLLEILNIIRKSSGESHPEPNLRYMRLEQIKKTLNIEEDTEFYEALMEVFSGLYKWVYEKSQLTNAST
ncbi:MAG: hypothetical protein EPN17_09815 [Methylobacter sp.]|nr:MAG: hypothetical protein EPN17_09815 [Methylobacter sp.]